MKKIYYFFFILLLASCVAETKKAQSSSSSTKGADNTAAGDDFVPDPENAVAVKTFNQYNMSLSKATDVDAATPDVANEYNLIKYSLPSEHDVANFTPFHQITMTRLAFAYCKYFIDNNVDFKALNYTTTTPEVLTAQLMTRFIGARTASNGASFDKTQTAVLKIMQNNAGSDENGATIGKLVPNATNTATERKNLAKLACTAILSSAEFTTL